jgi:hypothetical protein
MADDKKRRGQLPLELDCSDYKARERTFAPTPGASDGIFSCSLGPLPEETIAALDWAARVHGRVRLCFGSYAMLLELVALERKPARRVRLSGRVVQSVTA